MKHLQIILLLLLSASGFAQNHTEDDQVKKVVTDFFEAFHQQDSLALRKLAHPEVFMQSVSTNPSGETKVVTVDYGKFLKSIVSIPATTKFEEKLHSFEVTMNGSLATIVTPFSFYLNGNLSHCGVNSFTMVKDADDWKIVHIIDTRIKEGCEE